MVDVVPLYEVSLLLVVGFIITFLTLPVLMRKTKEIGIVGYDVHKIDRPIIPEMGGLAILAGIILSTILGMYMIPEKRELFISFLSTVLIAGVIGAYDDLKPLNARRYLLLRLFK